MLFALHSVFSSTASVSVFSEQACLPVRVLVISLLVARVCFSALAVRPGGCSGPGRAISSFFQRQYNTHAHRSGCASGKSFLASWYRNVLETHSEHFEPLSLHLVFLWVYCPWSFFRTFFLGVSMCPHLLFLLSVASCMPLPVLWWVPWRVSLIYPTQEAPWKCTLSPSVA